MSKHFIIVPAHLDKKYKEPIAINLLKQLSDIPDISICFCSHHKNIPDKIYEYSDYVIFDKNNPILNWDICDEVTRKFNCVLNDIAYALPYHGYAHFLSLCDGLALGMNTGHKTFSFMNYDVIDFCVKQLPAHIDEIKKNVWDSIFYPYLDTLLCTEFFTFNTKVALAFYEFRNFEKFKSFDNVMLEYVVTNIIKFKHIKNVLVESQTIDESLGRVKFNNDNKTNNDVPYFSPYGMVDGFIMPFKRERKYFILGSYTDKDVTILLNDIEHDIRLPTKVDFPCKLVVKKNNKIVKNFDLNNDKHFGYII